MWSGTILIHRPFIGRWQSHQDSPSSLNPLNICLQAANSICLVLEKYFDHLPGLPCDIVFPLFTAASTFLYHSRNVNPDHEKTSQRRLELCIHWLSIFGRSWKTAGARRQLLADSEYELTDIIRPLINCSSVRISSRARPASTGLRPSLGRAS